MSGDSHYVITKGGNKVEPVQGNNKESLVSHPKQRTSQNFAMG